MTTKLPSNVVEFAAGDTSLYESFRDYWHQFVAETTGKKYTFSTIDKDGKPITLRDKEQAINAALLREVGRKANFDITSVPLEQAMTHPTVCWAVGNIVSTMIEAILPDTIIDSTAPYAEVRTVGYGESGIFDIQSRELFLVSRAGQASMREAEMHKGFEGQVSVNPEMRQITVGGVSLYRLLAGLESLSRFTIKAIRSIETAMTQDIYDVFDDAMAALDATATTGLRVTGYTQADMVQLAQRVSGYMGGAAPVMLGTKVALQSVLPDDPNYVYDIESPFITLGHVRNISGVSIFELPQVANWNSPFSTYLDDTRLYIVAPGADKLVKVVLGGATISNVTGTFDKATMLQNATFWKSWKAAIVTSSLAATIDLS